MDKSFWQGRRVLITGHTGFKGAWLSYILLKAGAWVFGYSLEPAAVPNLFDTLNLADSMNSIDGDIRDFQRLNGAFREIKPEIVFHLAAQPIVRDSYKSPVYTYETNVMGTVNVLECIRLCESVRSFVNVTTDKVYQNNEWCWGYRENDRLGGHDPYSNSKSCSELVTHGYRNSFFYKDGMAAISTARAGNVIGGGDFASDRIVPDCVRAAQNKECIIVRNPDSIRPYQHVTECLSGYLLLAQRQYEDKKKYEGSYNFGPDGDSCVTTRTLVDLFCKEWGEDQKWLAKGDGGPQEASILKLDCSKAKDVLGWKPVWSIEEAIHATVEWYKVYIDRYRVTEVMENQVQDFFYM